MKRLALSSAFAFITACGGNAPQGVVTVPGAPTPLDPVALLPADVDAVARIDLGRFRQSPYQGTVMGWVDRVMALMPQAELARQWLDRVDVVVVGHRDSTAMQRSASNRPAFKRPPDEAGVEVELHDTQLVIEPTVEEGDFFAVVVGRFDDLSLSDLLREVERSMAERDQRPPSEARTERRGDRTVMFVDQQAFVAVDDHLWISAPAARIDEMLGRLNGDPGPSPWANAARRAMADRIQFGRSLFSGVLTVEPDSQPTGDDALSQVLGQAGPVGFRLDLSNGIDAEAVVSVRDALVAEQLATEWRGDVREAAGDLGVQMMGLGAVLGAIEVRSDHSTVVVTAQMNDGDTRALIARVDAMMGLFLGFMQSSRSPASGYIPFTFKQ